MWDWVLGICGINKMKESYVIRVVKDYLQIQRNQKKLVYIRNNSGAMPIIDGENKRRYIKFGDKGSPDFLIWMPGIINNPDFPAILRAIAIECKSDIGRQSEDQIEWQKDFEAIGGEYYIVKSIEDLVKIIL